MIHYSWYVYRYLLSSIVPFLMPRQIYLSLQPLVTVTGSLNLKIRTEINVC
jgi:hypothetical protein